MKKINRCTNIEFFCTRCNKFRYHMDALFSGPNCKCADPIEVKPQVEDVAAELVEPERVICWKRGDVLFVYDRDWETKHPCDT